jgi:NAD(P)-dependent dehydrogenase (short-subunit alcohol dehydrogenase family)
MMAGARYPSLAGRHVLVTGGGSGIGEGLVAAFSAQGARVSFIDIAETESVAVAARHPEARFLRCDLTKLDDLAVALETFAAERGPIEILLNNAANDDRHALSEITPAYFDNRIAINLRHLIFAAQHVAPAMAAAGRGVIINLGSISWHLGLTGLVLYETAKAAIEGMTRALARDLGKSGIRVNCIVPGSVQTPRQERWYSPEAEAEIVRAQCLAGRIQPADIAAMALFLASDDSRMCTGHNYWVDAGWR